MTGYFWPSPDQDRRKGQSFEHHLLRVKDLEEAVTKEIITDIIPVAQSPLAARTQRALTFSLDLTTDVNNILISHETSYAASCSGKSDDLVITRAKFGSLGLNFY